MQLQSSALERNTVLALFVILSLSAIDNAVMHLTFIASAALALVYMATGTLKPRLDGAIGLFVALSAIYFLIQLAYFLLHYGTYFPTTGNEWSQPLKHIIFVLPFFVAARLAVVPGERLLRTVWIASAAWGLVTFPIAFYQGFVLDIRAEAGTGNAIPFAAMGAIFSCYALLGLNDPDKRHRWLAAAGFCTGFLCVLFSQTKSIMPVPIVGLALFWLFFFRNRMTIWQIGAVALGVLVLAGLGVYFSDSWHRFADLWAVYVERDNTAALGNSYTQRLTMWVHGLAGVMDAPFAGHGFQNRRHFIGLLGYDYNHWHNGFITAAFDNGILGLVVMVLLLLSPVWIAWRCPPDELYRPRLFMAIMLIFVYVWGGMVNQIFGHGIYNALFLWGGMVIAVSATPKASDDVEGSA